MRTDLFVRPLLLASAWTLAASGLHAQGPVQLTVAEYRDLKAHGQLPAEFVVTTDGYTTPARPDLRGGGGGNDPCSIWVDPTPDYIPPDPDTPPDDGSTEEIQLPFTFNLYGDLYTSCYVNNNGNVSFGTPYGAFSATGFPDPGFVMVAPFWGDVDISSIGQIYYYVTPHALFVNWIDVGYFNSESDKTNTFQLIITDGLEPMIGLGNNVSFCYKDMQWTTGSASGGTNGFGGTPATVGANRGNATDFIQIGRFDHAGVDYDGPFGGADGVSWLDNRHFEFNTATDGSSSTGTNIPPIAIGGQSCDTMLVCTGTITTLSMQFIGPEIDQSVSIALDAGGLANYSVVSNTAGQTAEMVVQITPQPGDVGYYNVIFTGTDDGDPAQSAGYQVVLDVQLTAFFDPSSVTLCDEGVPFDLYTALQGGPLPGGSWTTPTGAPHTGIFYPGVDAGGVYQYAVGDADVCPAVGELTVVAVPHADAGQGGPLAYCSSTAPVDLLTQLAGTPQSVGTWYDPYGAVMSGQLDPSTAMPGTYTYLITGTSPCPNDTSFLDIAIPQAVDAGQDASIAFCRDAAPFSLRGQLAGTPQPTGVWTNMLGAIVPDQFDPATGTFGVYTYTVSAVAPCPDRTAQLTIAIDPLPVAGGDASLVACANDNDVPLFSLLGGAPDPDQHWLDPLGAEHSGVLDPSLEVSGIYQYISIGPNTCAHLSDTALVDVLINPVPVITYTADPDSGCHPLLVRFTNTTDPIYVGNSCIWDPGDGTGPVAECGGFEHLYEQPGWYHVKLKITTPEGCTDELVTPGAILVDPAPVAEFTWTPEFGTIGNSTFVFTATDPHAVDFLWDFPQLDVDTLRQVQRTFEDAIAGSYDVCLGVADRYGCTDTLCKTVQVVVENIFVPTAFTPNGDGRNDVLIPMTTSVAPNEYEFTVFDRWGHVVFQSREMNKGWDGTRNGTQLPLGSYVWKLSARPLGASERQDHFGTVLLTK